MCSYATHGLLQVHNNLIFSYLWPTLCRSVWAIRRWRTCLWSKRRCTRGRGLNTQSRCSHSWCHWRHRAMSPGMWALAMAKLQSRYAVPPISPSHATCFICQSFLRKSNHIAQLYILASKPVSTFVELNRICRILWVMSTIVTSVLGTNECDLANKWTHPSSTTILGHLSFICKKLSFEKLPQWHEMPYDTKMPYIVYYFSNRSTYFSGVKKLACTP